MMQAIEDLRVAFHKHCERGAAETAAVVATLQAVKESVQEVTSCVTRGGNGKSLVERVGAIEIRLDTLVAQVSKLSDGLVEQPKLRLAFWGPVACSLIASATAILVAVLK